MACKYCKDEAFLIDTRRGHFSSKRDFAYGIRVDIVRNELGIEAVADTYEPNYMEEYVKIKFCPMCGEKLVQEE